MICKKAFVINRGIEDLLLKQRYFICNKCYLEHPIKLEYTDIPLDSKYMLHIISLLNENDKSYYLAYLNEYSYLIQKYLDKPIILYDVFYLSTNNIKDLSIIASLERSNIYVICFKFIIN